MAIHGREGLAVRSFSSRHERALVDHTFRRELGIIAPHLLDDALDVPVPDQHLELDAEREVG